MPSTLTMESGTELESLVGVTSFTVHVMVTSCLILLGVEGESVEVDYVDYGNKETVATSAIAPLPHQLIDIPPQVATF